MAMPQKDDPIFDKDFDELIANSAGVAPDVAATLCQAFIHKYPERAEGFFLFGVLSYRLNRKGDAMTMMETAHKLDPDNREVAIALSSLYALREQLRDALYFSKLGLSLEENEKLAPILPVELSNFINMINHSVPHYHYVNALYAVTQGDFENAVEQCQLELSMHPRYEPAMLVLAQSHIGLGSYGAGAETLQKIIDQNPQSKPEVFLSLAEALLHLGLFQNAKTYLQYVFEGEDAEADDKAFAISLMALMPDCENDTDQMIATLNKTELTESKPHFPYEPFEDEQVRVAFLSDKFYKCSEGKFLNYLVQRMDRKVFVPHGYMQNKRRDSLTDSFVNEMAVAREVYDVDDKTLSLIMQRDGIDVLIDMCGFGANQRVSFLSRRPCGTRVSWLAQNKILPQPGVDTVFCDAGCSDQKSGTTAIEIPTGRFAMFANDACTEIGELPAKVKGYVNMACHLDLAGFACGDAQLIQALLEKNENAKLTIRVPKGVSDLELQLLNGYFGEEIGERIVLSSPDGLETPGAFYGDVDIYLATTYASIDEVFLALYMGVPVVARKRDHVAMAPYLEIIRNGVGKEWVCSDDETFMTTVMGIVGDVDGLAQTRRSLRSSLEGSKIMNADAVVLQFMHAILQARSLIGPHASKNEGS